MASINTSLPAADPWPESFIRMVRLPAASQPPFRTAYAFVATVHAAQKRDDLWLGQHPLVEAIRNGSGTRNQLERWVRQIYCITQTYGETLRSLRPPPPVGVCLDPWLELDLLAHLGESLGIPASDLPLSQPTLATRAVQVWLRQNLRSRSRHIAAQACWALVEAMSLETRADLAEGARRHFGLSDRELAYFTAGMRSRRHADRYAASLLQQVNVLEWDALREHTLRLTRQMLRLYDSVAEQRGLSSKLIAE